MIRTFRKTSTTMLASAALATAGLLAPVPARADFSFRCHAIVAQYCTANWQALGFSSDLDCFWYWDDAACRQYPAQPWDPNWPYLPPVP